MKFVTPRNIRRFAYVACMFLALTIGVLGQRSYGPMVAHGKVSCAGDASCANLMGAWFEPAKR